MAFDINNTYTGKLFGRDRMGHTTPDAEATELFRPWLPVPYPAPYLPGRRADQGHPVLANVVISSQHAVGQDKSGGIVPAGLFCGSQTIVGHATGAGYCVLKYGASDVGFAYNATTGALVAAAGEVAVLAAPSDGVAGDVVTFSDTTTYTITAGNVTAGLACTLFPMGVVKPIGFTTRNVFQYLGGVTIVDTTGGMNYTLNGVIPTKFAVHNYMHEMGIAVQTEYVLRVPWIGTLPTTLTTLTGTDSVAGYLQTDYGRSFVHITGAAGSGNGKLAYGNFVVPSRLGAGADSGNLTPYDSTKHDALDICGRIIGIQNMYPIRDYMTRVRTLWDPSRLVGPVKDPNASSYQMGGSATAGVDYQLNLGTDGAFAKAFNQGKTLRPEYSTQVMVLVRP